MTQRKRNATNDATNDATALTTTATTTTGDFDINARARAVYGPDVTWTFVHLSEAWYASTSLPRTPSVVDEISLVLAYAEGGCVAEAAIGYHDLNLSGHTAHIAPMLEIFDDAWAVCFGLAPEIFSTLATLAGVPRRDTGGYLQSPVGDTSARAVIAALRALGVKDTTPHTSPYGEPSEAGERRELGAPGE